MNMEPIIRHMVDTESFHSVPSTSDSPDSQNRAKADKIYAKVIEAEEKLRINTFLALLEQLKGSCSKSEFKGYWKKRCIDKDHPWDEIIKVVNYTKVAFTSHHGTTISEISDDTCKMSVKFAYTADKSIDIAMSGSFHNRVAPISALLLEPQLYGEWAPGMAAGAKLRTDLGKGKFAAHVSMNSPMPSVVSHRDIALHIMLLDCSDRPKVQAKGGLVTKHRSIVMYGESVYKDESITEETEPILKSAIWKSTNAPKPLKTVRCTAKRFCAVISIAGENHIKFKARGIVNPHLIKVPEFFLRHVGGPIFAKVVRTAVSLARDVQVDKAAVDDNGIDDGMSKNCHALLKQIQGNQSLYSWLTEIEEKCFNKQKN